MPHPTSKLPHLLLPLRRLTEFIHQMHHRIAWQGIVPFLSLALSAHLIHGAREILKEYCRRGYSEKSFNTSDLVWNASLSRSFCKGKLTLKAEAFDILQNLSSTVYEVGGQGKTEKLNNTLPSYAMLHLMYKFSKAPKGKK